MEAINAIGRRKAAVARVYLMDGKGKITVNGKDYNDYFGSDILKYVVTQPLNELDATDRYDIVVNLEGGGIRGQAEAVRLGISRALVSLDGENKKPLKEKGFLTRDSALLKGKNRAGQKPERGSSSVNDRYPLP
jgi:small subunit ribosomal protein S9